MQITNPNLLSTKNYSVYVGESIQLKTNSGINYKIVKVSAFTDSTLVLENDSVYNYKQLKKIRLWANRPLCTFSRRILIRFGIMFAALNTVNQAITGNTPLIEPAAFAIGGGIVLLGAAFRPFEYHRVRLHKNAVYKVYVVGYSGNNEK